MLSLCLTVYIYKVLVAFADIRFMCVFQLRADIHALVFGVVGDFKCLPLEHVYCRAGCLDSVMCRT